MPLKLRGVILATLALSALTASAARADDTEHGTFSVLVENDVFYNTDRDYTAGQQVSYTTAADETPQGLVDFVRALPLLPDSGDVHASYEFGQDIFTPSDTAAVIPPLNERPYAAFLYLGLGLLANDDVHYDQLQFQLGVVGPWALGEEAQDFVHSILGQSKPAGWHYQLHNEPALQITYERAFKIIPPQSVFGLFFDLEPHLGASVGNVYDYANAGAMARFGYNLPDDFGPVRMEPALPGSSFYSIKDDFSAYIFAGIDGRAIARNIFLDGNSFEASRSIPKLPLIADFQLGAAIAFQPFELSFTHVFRTREYHGQPHSDQFGSVNLTIHT